MVLRDRTDRCSTEATRSRRHRITLAVAATLGARRGGAELHARRRSCTRFTEKLIATSVRPVFVVLAFVAVWSAAAHSRRVVGEVASPAAGTAGRIIASVIGQ